MFKKPGPERWRWGGIRMACQHRVKTIVDTVASPDEKAKTRIRSAVKTLTELLMTDHPAPCVHKEKQNAGDCELKALPAIRIDAIATQPTRNGASQL